MNSGVNKFSAHSAREYSSEADFCELFREQMNRYYFLALVLTADAEKAERCFVTGLESCLQSRRIFKEWAHRWAIHTIIKTAIDLVSPAQRKAQKPIHLPKSEASSSEPEALLAALESVPPLDRFVHYMTVVERYSDLECSTFLGCTPSEVRESRERVLLRVGNNEQLAQMVTDFNPGVAQVFIKSLVAKAS